MKLFAAIVIMSGVLNFAFASENSADIVTHTFGGEAAEAKFNIMTEPAVGNGPISICRHTGSKQELSKDGLERTVCTEVSGDVECGRSITTYSCTVTISKNGQKLPVLPIGAAL